MNRKAVYRSPEAFNMSAWQCPQKVHLGLRGSKAKLAAWVEAGDRGSRGIGVGWVSGVD